MPQRRRSTQCGRSQLRKRRILGCATLSGAALGATQLLVDNAGRLVWSIQSDAGLIHAYGYWATLLDTNQFHPDTRIGREDARNGELWIDHYSDADHASDYLRKSTGVSVALLESPTGQSRVLLDAGCEQQPSVAKSPGESETKALSDNVQDIAGVSHPTEDERDLIMRSADRVKALCTTTTRIAYPLNDLLKWLTKGRAQLRYGRMLVDATVCKAVAESGESRAIAYVKKTQAVDLLWLRDTIKQLQIEILKIDSARNCADLFTKAVSKGVLAALLPIIGRA